MRSDLVKVVEAQSLVISIQSGIIDDLFKLLGQYVSAEELDTLPAVAKINRAAQIRAEID